MRFLPPTHGRSFGSLLAAAALIGVATAPSAGAQENFDPGALDTKGSVQYAKPKGKKAAQSREAPAPAGKTGKPGGDRQFGELEGWSPGKAPPSKDKPDDPPTVPGGKAPMSLSPTGNMSVGLPF